MKVIKSAQAGTFESSDILILVEPAPEKSGIQVELNSSVKAQYEEDIKTDIHKVLTQLDIKDVHIIARDKGALSPTIQARVETAIKRATE
ncbi:MAG: citrate lyase acyl carrier protein [Hyphomicrobiales bacterium]